MNEAHKPIKSCAFFVISNVFYSCTKYDHFCQISGQREKKWQIKGDNMQSLFQLNTHSNFTKATNKPIFGCNNGRFLSAFIHTFLWTEMRGKIWNYGIFHTDRNLWLGHSLFAQITNIATANIWYFYSIDCFSVRRSNRPKKEEKNITGNAVTGIAIYFPLFLIH